MRNKFVLEPDDPTSEEFAPEPERAGCHAPAVVVAFLALVGVYALLLVVKWAIDWFFQITTNG